ncbi:MAG: V-type ATP synthase subunit I [Candidatus Saccharicenans sp.]|jgi:V/A-type H+-transporting ATPase subunit I|nr:V-type ATP synthase subunit I [Candidatus Saccharicenans sp.]MDH7493197.1 V-type ATP synthase subunit I [Candidatus Saccharicenans sp.]
MAIARVKRFEILLPAEELDGFLSHLQELGVAQLDPVPYEELELRPTETDPSEYERWLARIGRLLQNLPPSEEQKGLNRILAEKPKYSAGLRKALLDFGYQKVVEDYERLEARRNELLQEAKQLEREWEFLRPLSALPVPLRELTGLESCQVQFIQIQPQDLSLIQEQTRELPAEVFVVREEKSRVFILLLNHQTARDEVDRVFSEIKTVYISLAHYLVRIKGEERLADILVELQQKREEKLRLAQQLEKDMAGFAVHRPALMAVHDVLLSERERLAGAGLAGLTEKTCCLLGWIPGAEAESFAARVKNYSEHIYLNIREPKPEEMAEAPVILENPEIVRPFEVITGLYGLPQQRAIEPTIFLAPFFFVFVGLCVSEAGYGLVVTLLSLLYLKLARPKGGTELFLRLLVYLGISNVILGTLVGGWFGFPIKSLQLIDPLKDPIPFMILALILGFIQVMLSTFLSLVREYRSGNRAGAVAVKGGWLLLLPSLVGYLLLKKPVFGILALTGAAGIVFFSSKSRNPLARFFSGLYALYGISGYLADTLSYSRILALGLSTGVIAMVVNNLFQIVWKIPYVGWLAAILVFIGGHLFNLGIGFLGAFVHSMRLQFVEFFTRFYQSGGKPFKPLKLESKYVEFIR